MSVRLGVAAGASKLHGKALELASSLDLPLLSVDSSEAAFLLVLTPERLELREVGTKTGAVFADFASRRLVQAQQQRESLARAVGIKGDYRPSVLDATAGLGRDAFVLAAAGCRVLLLERSRVIAALLEDGLERVRGNLELAPMISRMSLYRADARDFLKQLSETERPEVIYLDPMYPESGKSAAKRKEMRFFRELVGADPDAEELLELARKQAKRRVVVKRPLKAAALTPKPGASLRGKTTRFDIYLV
jgi:16S rRNA (guanine1516-N2)-methyltransferase